MKEIFYFKHEKITYFEEILNIFKKVKFTIKK